MIISPHRQILTFLDIENTPVDHARYTYVHRGSLQYEHGSEILQTPIHLLRVTHAEAQVLQHLLGKSLF